MSELERLLSEGRRLKQLRQFDAALTIYQQALTLDPHHAGITNAIGVVYVHQHRFDEAQQQFQAAIQHRPSWPNPRYNLAKLVSDGYLSDSIDQIGTDAEIAGALSDPLRRLWMKSLQARKQFEQALNVGRKLTEPTTAERLWIGTRLALLERYVQAIPWLEQALLPNATDAEGWYTLGVVYQKLHRVDSAIAAFRQAIAFRPNHAESWNNIGNALKARMDFRGAQDAYSKALQIAPKKENTHRNRLLALQYDPEVSSADICKAHQEYGRQFDRPQPLIDIDWNPNRPLKIGYVSADFGSHPVGYFLLPVFLNHCRSSFHITAYAAPRPEDEVTRRLRLATDVWVDIQHLDDEALFHRIRADRIDILVDLGGHTRGSRLAVFGRKPAPVQISWAGYVGTTGLKSIDWVIGDLRHTPPGVEQNFIENIWRLPRSYICWEPPDVPEQKLLPMIRNRRKPILASFNNLPKLNLKVIAVWSRILHRLPDARLRLSTKSLAEERIKQQVITLFSANGISSERLILTGRVPRDELLTIYAEQVDLALDPFPYSGGLTTLEALWMGVPVVTLAGDRFASRHSLAHLGAIGLQRLVAATEDEYEQRVVELIENPNQLQEIRSGLRQRMQDSVLLDGKGFTQELETAFRGMWVHAIDLNR